MLGACSSFYGWKPRTISKKTAWSTRSRRSCGLLSLEGFPGCFGKRLDLAGRGGRGVVQCRWRSRSCLTRVDLERLASHAMCQLDASGGGCRAVVRAKCLQELRTYPSSICQETLIMRGGAEGRRVLNVYQDCRPGMFISFDAVSTYHTTRPSFVRGLTCSHLPARVPRPHSPPFNRPPGRGSSSTSCSALG